MTDPTVKVSKAADVYAASAALAREVPRAEDFFLTPVAFINCLCEIGPKIQRSGAWWAVTGDAGENLLDVHVRPSEIEILTDKDGLGKICNALAEFEPTPAAPTEGKLEREAEPDEKKYPVFFRSISTELKVNGVRVTVHADYQMKVGEWEWGDSLMFPPTFVNVAGVDIPLMPLRLRSEIYLTLGWMDRAQLISEATQRAHAFVKQLSEGT